MKTTNIRGLSHNIVERDNTQNPDCWGNFQCVIPGHELEDGLWEFTESRAKSEARRRVDSALSSTTRFDTFESDHPLGDLVICLGMSEYSGWGWKEHAEWVQDETGIDGLVDFVKWGGVIITDDNCDLVHVMGINHCDAPAHCIWEMP